MEHFSCVRPNAKFPGKVENLKRWTRLPGWNFRTECRVPFTFLVDCTSSRSTVRHSDVPGFMTKWNNFLPIGNWTWASTEKRIILNEIWENNSFCASLIEGLRRAFLFVDCVNQELADYVCLCRSVRVLTKTEWNTRGAKVCSLYENFFICFCCFVFFVTWKLLWIQNNQW